MVVARTCKALRDNGEPCRAAPLRDSAYCLWHDPEHIEEVTEARRLGGLRRKRERTLAGAYELDGFDTVPQIRRVVEIVVLDTLGMENSIARGRLLIAAGLALAKLLEVGELAERVAAIEASLKPRLAKEPRRR